MPRARLALVALLAAGTLLALALPEAALRLQAHFEDRGLLTRELDLPPDPEPGHPISLAGIIRRSPNPRLVYELRPGLAVTFEGAPVAINAAGYRGPLHSAESTGSFRIVGLGDSFMFGFGVADQQAYLARLESRLNRAAPTPRVEVVNLAVPGYNTVMEVEALERKGVAYHPDVVLIEFISNDFDLPNFVWRARDVWSLDESYLFGFVRQRLRMLRGRRPAASRDVLVAAPKDAPEDPHFARDPSRIPAEYAALVGWDAYQAAMRRLAELARTHHFSVVLMAWDAIPEEQQVRRLSTRLGFHVLNLGPRVEEYLRANGLRVRETSPLVRGSGDNHPSALGHELVSEWLEAFLRAQHLLPEPVARNSAGPRRDRTALG